MKLVAPNKSLQATATALVSWTGVGIMNVIIAVLSQSPVAVPELLTARWQLMNNFGQPFSPAVAGR